jgi:ABC-type enterobactin transport system permease subunit
MTTTTAVPMPRRRTRPLAILALVLVCLGILAAACGSGPSIVSGDRPDSRAAYGGAEDGEVVSVGRSRKARADQPSFVNAASTRSGAAGSSSIRTPLAS